MTTTQPFPYSENPQPGNGKPVPPPPPSFMSWIKGKSQPSGQTPRPTPESEPEDISTPPKEEAVKSQTLRSRLLLVLLPTTLLPLVTISAVNYWISQNQLQEEQEFILEKTAFNAEELSASFVEELRTDAKSLAVNPLLQQALQSADQEVAQKNLTQIPIERLEEYYGGSKLLQPSTAVNVYLQNIAETENLAEIFVTNRDGFNVAYSNRTSDFVQNDEAWWQGAKADGFYVEPPEYDDSADAYVLPLSTAIQDANTADFAGVIKSGASLEGLNTALLDFLDGTMKDLKQVQIVDPFTSQIIASVSSDADGQVTATPVSEVVSQAVTGGDAVAAVAVDLKEAVLDPTQTPDQLVQTLEQAHNLKKTRIERLGTEQNGFIMAQFALDGRTYAIATIRDTDWVAISSIETADIRSVNYFILFEFLIIGALMSAIAVAIVLYLSRQISNPINQLSAAANQMASGDLNVTAEATGTVETRQLAGTFNNLVQQVKALLKRQQDETERVQLLAAIAQSKDDDDMQVPLNKHLDEIRLKLSADRVVVYRFKPDMSGYITGEAVVQGFPTALGDTISDPCIPPALIDAYKAGRVVPTDDVMRAGFHPDHQQLMVRLQIKSNLVVPIVIAGKLFGLLVAHHCAQPHAWQTEEINLLQAEAEQLGVSISSLAAIEAQTLAAEEQQQRRQDLEMQLLGMMERIEGAVEGDLTARAQLMEGEIGIVADLFNAVIENLQEIAVQVRDSSGQVNQSLNKNEIAIRRLAEKAISEAKEIQKALGSVQSMSQAIETIAQNADEASTIANSAYAAVQEGNQAMDQTVNSILGLRTTIGDTTKKMKRLGESAQKISQVVALIDELALKTNLLSINASVEAARAGELGEGFTAVAEQVGTLAEQSASATKEIAKIVASIQSETQELVEAMETGTTQVVDSTHQVENTKLQLTEVLHRSQEIDQLMRAISESTIAQAESAQSVTTVMQAVTQASKQRSLASREVAQAMQATAQVSQKLQASVEQFKVD
ncbi:GAF domain-containing protein [Nodosilinea sp. LEGE 07088]|uniref:methyl-accepting chemotaxis protein n=1 Tax=Nodosilinea sp. LEGE 07088 TaxID=2777968 RepID=UPI001880034F|nr:methyl-accepting chemotaxis protein [Nodosilinea sp. LEGE 07088]MBE9136394.1 GAF domain-containing protein [Nodosilinea sp. LEGE 07088]